MINKNRVSSKFLLKGIAYILWIHLRPHAEWPIHLHILYACVRKESEHTFSGWEYSSVVEYMLSIYNILTCLASTTP